MAGRVDAATAVRCGRRDLPRRVRSTRSSCAKIASIVPVLNAQPLRRQIVVTTCALLLLLGGAIVWPANRTRIEREAEVRQEAISVARLATAYLNQYFDGLDAMASVLLRNPAISTFNQAEANKLFADLMREQPLLLAVVLRDRTGTLVASGA